MSFSNHLTRIRFRHLQDSDFTPLWYFASDKEVTRFLTWSPYTTQEELQKYLASAKTKCRFPDEVLAIEENDGHMIGTVHFIARDSHAVQFGFGIASRYWGLGLGTEIVNTALEYLHKDQCWSRLQVWADIHEENERAKRVLEKCGFTLVQKHIELHRNRYQYTIQSHKV